MILKPIKGGIYSRKLDGKRAENKTADFEDTEVLKRFRANRENSKETGDPLSRGGADKYFTRRTKKCNKKESTDDVVKCMRLVDALKARFYAGEITPNSENSSSWWKIHTDVVS